MKRLRQIWCDLFGHKFVATKKVDDDIFELKCTRCKNEYGFHRKMAMVLLLDGDLKNVHKLLAKTKPLEC